MKVRLNCFHFILPLSSFALCLPSRSGFCFVCVDELGVALAKALVRDALASRHEAVGELCGREAHVVSRVLEPEATVMRGLLVLFYDGLARALELGERRRHVG